MFGDLSKFLFKVNKNLLKDIQIKKAAEMAADDYGGDGIHY